jgi:hypothetical protein
MSNLAELAEGEESDSLDGGDKLVEIAVVAAVFHHRC